MELLPLKLVAKMYVQNKQGKYLLLKRSDDDKYRPGEWDLPGGSVDQGEDPIDAVLREVKEETNIEVTNYKILTTYSSVTNKHVVTLLYFGEALSEDIIVSREHSEFEWVSVKEILKKNMPDKYKIVAREYLLT
jgi:8-oxo-dGTP diphosphatase